MISLLPDRESLSQRLREIAPPRTVEVAGHALAAAAAAPETRPKRGNRPRRWRLVSVLAGILILNTAALYLSPAYAAKLAEVPGLGTILGWTGLSAADVTALDATAEHDGISVHVSAGYADENQTLLFFQERGPSPKFEGNAFRTLSLTDQFGRRYDGPGISLLAPDASRPHLAGQPLALVAQFAPTSGPAAVLGARLTLQAQTWAPLGGPDVGGMWTVHFVLLRHPATVAHWEPAGVSGATYTFPQVTITGSAVVHIDWQVQGPAVLAAINAATANAARPPSLPPGVTTWTPPLPIGVFLDPFTPRLVDSTGGTLTPLLHGTGLTFGGDQMSGGLDFAPRPGTYHLVVHLADGSGFARVLTVGSSRSGP
ncbi:MAG: DUF4179 domain-containing protein [Candidatus Dormibacteraeota bacterium]|uniref:DUF4179 domain-containing protein n=1 Tax=Candidatus Aeolococcus gillhamiae TaxID=3127015 RepID=A0A934JR44_9BACT|nr:DUF4179 domain-containing protein [Candidatus Dormibacteraeota bacterium]